MTVKTERYVDYCGVAEGGCLNPAGYQVGGMGGPSGSNPDPPRTSVECAWCGTICCAECRVKGLDGRWYCSFHEDEAARPVNGTL